jgi:hypothetical protein
MNDGPTKYDQEAPWCHCLAIIRGGYLDPPFIITDHRRIPHMAALSDWPFRRYYDQS